MKINLANDLMQFLHASLPDCPTPLIVQNVREATNEFLLKTFAWRMDLDPIYRRAGTTDYELDGIPDGTKILRVLKVENEDRELLAGRHYTCPSRDVLRLTSEPGTSASRALQVQVALNLADTTTEVDDESFGKWWSDWRQAIVHLTISRMQRFGGKKWSNEDDAKTHYTMAYDIIAQCKRELLKEGTTASLTAAGRHRFTLR